MSFGLGIYVLSIHVAIGLLVTGAPLGLEAIAGVAPGSGRDGVDGADGARRPELDLILDMLYIGSLNITLVPLQIYVGYTGS